ncbi:MAG: hypothetical protein RL657_1637, partial [Pseudomonadota bacterium]
HHWPPGGSDLIIDKDYYICYGY